MSPESLLAEKLTAYRSRFDEACRALFSGGESVTLDYGHDDDEDLEITSERVGDRMGVSNSGSNSANPVSEPGDGLAVRSAICGAVHWIAQDFASEFNTRLAAAARTDPTVGLVAPNYAMSPEHMDELEALLVAPVEPLLAKLDTDDLDGARRATLEAWPRLERRIRTKWQAYFVFTFQDVSVERKAARDRRKHQTRFDPTTEDRTAQAAARWQSLRDRSAVDARPPRISRWIMVGALLLFAATGAWLLTRHAHRPSVAASGAPRP